MFDWDDLRHFLAVASSGSTTAAARLLGVDQSTVQRRLAELERRLGQPLAERHPAGYRLTPFGEQLLPHARRVEESVLALEDVVRSCARELTGVVRVTCPEPIVYRLSKSPLLERFRARHPHLQVEFLMSDRYLDLGKGEADVALRSGDTVDSELVGRKVGDSLWAVYGSHAYIARHGEPRCVEDLSHHALVGFDDSMSGHRANAWLRQVAPGARWAATADSVLGLVSSAKAGMGLAPLPTALGDAESELARVLGPIPELTRIWRILTTKRLRRTPRVSAFFDFMAAEVEALRPILTG
ncbi:MAG: LysR family transcriptional regulator [Ramlibacter sp.]|nr:LysR family transcriptional regulator [Ramlibacter sp.]